MANRTATIADFLNAAGARQPAPGGGSVAALVGALAASMGEMVLNYSVGKKGLEAHQAELTAILHDFNRIRLLMVGLMEEDQVAYAALTAAKKLPADAPERATQFPAALVASIRTPQAMGAAALAILQLCERAVGLANKYLLSDLAVCADLATSTARCAMYNIQANLPDIPDAGERRTVEADAHAMCARAISTVQRVGPAIWKRHAQEV